MRDALIAAMAKALADSNGDPLLQMYGNRAAHVLDAALSILESPSDEMLEAGQEICGKAYVGHGFESEIAEPEEVFAAMLNTLKAPA